MPTTRALKGQETMKELQNFEQHPYKRQLRFYEINQTTLAKNLGISQPALNQQLNGYREMDEKVESEIQDLLDILKARETAKGKKNGKRN